MGSRVPPRRPEELSPEEKAEYDTFSGQLSSGGFNEKIFRWKDENGALIGPLALFMAYPELGHRATDLIFSVGSLKGLPNDAKETAILVCGGNFQAAYELYAHENVAEKAGYLSKSQIEWIKENRKPADLNSSCSLAYDVARRLCSAPGPLPDDLWQGSVEAFGKEGAIALVQYTALYAYISITLNGLDVPVPTN